jgi:hypothetical protein
MAVKWAVNSDSLLVVATVARTVGKMGTRKVESRAWLSVVPTVTMKAGTMGRWTVESLAALTVALTAAWTADCLDEIEADLLAY